MKTEEVSNLKKALFVLLYDGYDTPELEVSDDDSTYIDCIIRALIEKNDEICPYKNYDCIGYCKESNICCIEGLKADCNRELEDMWKDFIGIQNDKASSQK